MNIIVHEQASRSRPRRMPDALQRNTGHGGILTEVVHA